MYRALYRKYRPAVFADVVGQPHITTTLQNQLKAGKIFHAYLFTGSRGTGKTTCAKILAKAANCLNPVNGDACGVCEMCRGVEAGEVLDIVEIDAASNNGVDNIRDLKEQTSYTPAVGKYRVYIIDEVHMLSTGAFNALLKTLEEPPAHILFILATTEVHKLPATILSRCQRFDFRRIDPEVIVERLQYVAGQEGFALEPAAAGLIASVADGGMRDALSILDLCAARGGTVTEADVESACAMAGKDHIFDLCNSILQGDIPACIRQIDTVYTAAVDMQRLCEDLIAHYRDLMILKTIPDEKGLVVCSVQQRAKLVAQAGQHSLERILLALHILPTALDRMTTANRRSELEMAVIRLCTPQLLAQPEGLLARIERLEAALQKGVPAVPAQPVVAQPAPAPERPAQPSTAPAKVAPQEDLPEPPPEFDEPVLPEPPAPVIEEAEQPSAPQGEAALPQWDEILKELTATCPLMAGILGGSAAYVQGGTLLIDSQNSQFLDLMRGNNPIYRNYIRTAAEKVLGKQYKLGPYQKPKAETQQDPLEDIKRKLAQLEVPPTF